MNQVEGEQIRGDGGESIRKGKDRSVQGGEGRSLLDREERPTLGSIYSLYQLQGILAFVVPLACLAPYYVAYAATGGSSGVAMVLGMTLTILIGQTVAWIASATETRRIGVLGSERPTIACLVTYCACMSFVVVCLVLGTRFFHVRGLDRDAALRLTALAIVTLLLVAVASALAGGPTADRAGKSTPPVWGQPGPPDRQRRGGGPITPELQRFVYRHQGLAMFSVAAAITLMPGGVCKRGWVVFIGVLFFSPIAFFSLLLVRAVMHSRIKRPNDVVRATSAPTAVFLDGRLRKHDPLWTGHV